MANFLKTWLTRKDHLRAARKYLADRNILSEVKESGHGFHVLIMHVPTKMTEVQAREVLTAATPRAFLTDDCVQWVSE